MNADPRRGNSDASPGSGVVSSPESIDLLQLQQEHRLDAERIPRDGENPIAVDLADAEATRNECGAAPPSGSVDDVPETVSGRHRCVRGDPQLAVAARDQSADLRDSFRERSRGEIAVLENPLLVGPHVREKSGGEAFPVGGRDWARRRVDLDPPHRLAGRAVVVDREVAAGRHEEGRVVESVGGPHGEWRKGPPHGTADRDDVSSSRG
jgi:hypothetical protein